MAKQLKRRIVLGVSTQRKLERLALRHSLTASIAASRTVDWLVKQPEMIQTVVLGRFNGAVNAELAELIIRSLAK